MVQFLGLPDSHLKADLHKGLLVTLKAFLAELGGDFCFIGSEYSLQVGGRDFALYLLFFHRGLNALVAIERKIGRFEPEHLVAVLASSYVSCICAVYDSYTERQMGIVNIDDDLHDQLRRASKVSFRSINAQAAFWIRIGMLCETNPTLSFSEIVARELRSAGVSAEPLALIDA